VLLPLGEIEPALGADASRLPTLAEVRALCDAEFRRPIPTYEPDAGLRFNGTGRGDHA
jgi:hypothetical protein